MKVQSYRELVVWQKSMELCIEVYRITETYPRAETYGLTHQSRKSAVSIPSNIAEGWTRQHRLEFLQSLNIALASAAELETQLIIANKLGYLSVEEFAKINSMNIEVMKMLNAMITNLKGIR